MTDAHRCVLALIVVCAAAGACGGPTAPPKPSPPVAGNVADDAGATPDAPSGRAGMTAMLVGKGYTATPIDATSTLVCASGDRCVCLVDLDCTGSACITFDDNVAAFRKALNATGDTQVSCELADTGRLCGGSYFRFEGDIYRLEDRFFGPDGHLIGMKNATDYPEYCGGQAMYQFAGTIPDCPQGPTDVKVICTDKRHDHPLGNPMDYVTFAFER